MVKQKPLKGLGPKYGATLRKRYSAIQRVLKAKRACPRCGSHTFRRVAVGIWECERCGYKVAGGAYSPE
ncbi:transposase [Conexivisphaera calida]|uniref:Large ribosomal subunit protein eL43 n=1 Tax=Conexivisphaera calida TaxID=1874277 RepID=A0A4P2VAR6_9ARCH|nr:transposase [Conexivisphaera calida]BBE41579.1 LSU ribosomal protein L37Ae [Conexivisphaera calida]